jgi:hypothetical protein
VIVSWFSAGCSSAVATKIALDKHPDLRIIYTHIDDQHHDTLRFLHDCEKWFGKQIEINQSDKYKSVEAACRGAAYLIGVAGAPCTKFLKRRVRKEWEIKNPGRHTYVWGLDLNELHRVERIKKSASDYDHEFPLIEKQLDKTIIHGMIEKAGIKRPAMYDLGYPNNNCIGCLKGKMGYWNKIRIDFPEVFKSRCDLEDVIGGRIFKEFKLKDLPENKGRMEIIVPDCGIFCEIPDGRRI